MGETMTNVWIGLLVLAWVLAVGWIVKKGILND